jgi:hypothetical protein
MASPFLMMKLYAKRTQNLMHYPQACRSIVDGLAFGVMPDIATAITMQRPVIALVHHPLAFEAGLSPAQAARLKQTEKQALAYASQIIVTSPATARDLTKHFEVSPERIKRCDSRNRSRCACDWLTE